MAAIAGTVSELYQIRPAQTRKTTYSASVVQGGTSVNAIPSDMFLEVDMRSEDSAALADLDTRLRQIVEKAVAAENTARSTTAGRVTYDLKLVGDRPAGRMAADADIVRATQGAIRAMGFTPDFHASSTDSDLAMSIGVPAVTLGYGGGRSLAFARRI